MMNNWVYHVTTLKKLKKYEQTGFITPPVRGWNKIEDAVNFSWQTGRHVILRILLPNKHKLLGHKGNASYCDIPTPINYHEVKRSRKTKSRGGSA